MEQKPFRGFDITSLIRKDEEQSRASNVNRPESKSANVEAKDHEGCISHRPCSHKLAKLTQSFPFPGEDGKSPTLVGGSGSPCSSPNISVGPPQSPPTNPYTNLFNSSLYQQYLGQLLANGGGPQTPLNPMLLQVRTHLVFFFYNPLLKCSTCAGPACHGCPEQPGPLAGQLQQPRHQLDLRTSEGLEQVLAVPGVLDHRADRLHVGLLLPNGHRVRVQVVGRGVQAGRAARHPAAHQVRQPPGVAASLGQPAQVNQDLLFFSSGSCLRAL